MNFIKILVYTVWFSLIVAYVVFIYRLWKDGKRK